MATEAQPKQADAHGSAKLYDASLERGALRREKSKKKSAELEKYAEGLTELMGDARCDLVERSADLLPLYERPAKEKTLP